MRRQRRGALGAALPALAVAWASSALGAPEPSQPVSGELPPAAPAEGEAAPDAPADAAAEASDSNDTRASALRAYQKALQNKQLAATTPLSTQLLREELNRIEQKLNDGRRDEAIGDLVYLVESDRFEPFSQGEEGRAARFLLGDALGRAGAYQPARGYLLPLLVGDASDLWYRRSVRSLVDIGLGSGDPEPFVAALGSLPAGTPAELVGDVNYLRGRSHERKREYQAALGEYAKVGERSRFWAQATYLSGLIEVERGRLRQGENLFCRVAEPKLTPRLAPVFGGDNFFRVRDLARLGLGRVAHEQYRFDDARYYYYLVPRDSDHVSEALYETATTRYEAKDYDGAREAMDELKSFQQNHVYEDEAWLLDAYIDLAACRFPSADAKLSEFLKRYEPVRDAARRVAGDASAVGRLVESVRTGGDPSAAGLGVPARTAQALAALLRVDRRYALATRRLAQLDHQLSGLRGAMGELDEARRRLAAPDQVRPQMAAPLSQSSAERRARAEAQIAELRRLIREAETSRASSEALAGLKREAEALELRARALSVVAPSGVPASGGEEQDLAALLAADRERASALHRSAAAARSRVESEQTRLAHDALLRLDLRLSRLLRRGRLGRIETVLGKKRALELEVEALSQGLLPQSVVDSLEAERYMRDDEEYWPFDGEDWEDEYVGGEGLR